MTNSEFDFLKKAVEGLLYPSESDFPFDLFLLPSQPNTTPRQIALSYAKKKKPVQEVSVEDFFTALKDSDDAPRFDDLHSKLQSSLRNLQIFRVGSIEVDIYLIGQSSSGDWIVLHTISVET